MHPEFLLAPDLIYLNHAAISPWPKRTQEAVVAFARENARQGSLDYRRWMETETQLRQRLQALLNAPSVEDIALVKSTSEGLSIIAYGLDWPRGSNIVSLAGEFPSNRIVWESLVNRGVDLRLATVRFDTDPVEQLAAQVDKHTRLIAVSSVQYASGLRIDLERLGQFCREHHILLCVDAIQSLGAMRFDVQKCQAHFVVADGHKWMLGPEGLGVFYCEASLREQLHLTQYGWHMVEYAGDYDRPDWMPAASGRRFECGSPNTLGIHALNASLSLLLDTGMEAVEQAVLGRAHKLIETIQARPQLDLLSPSERSRHAGIITFRHRRHTAEELHARLSQAGVICALRGGGIRFSPHFYTPLESLDRAMEIVAS